MNLYEFKNVFFKLVKFVIFPFFIVLNVTHTYICVLHSFITNHCELFMSC